MSDVEEREDNGHKLEFHYGVLTGIDNTPIKDLNLPDWELQYIEYKDKDATYQSLRRNGYKIVKVTKSRIYFMPE